MYIHNLSTAIRPRRRCTLNIVRIAVTLLSYYSGRVLDSEAATASTDDIYTFIIIIIIGHNTGSRRSAGACNRERERERPVVCIICIPTVYIIL